MSSPTNDKPLYPGEHYALAIGGALASSLFSYAVYSSQHTTAFKVSLIVGAVLSLLVQGAIAMEKKDKSKEQLRVVPIGIFGYLFPVGVGFQLTMRAIYSAIFPSTWVREVSTRNVTFMGGLTLGYAATNALFESYRFYRSMGSQS